MEEWIIYTKKNQKLLKKSRLYAVESWIILLIGSLSIFWMGLQNSAQLILLSPLVTVSLFFSSLYIKKAYFFPSKNHIVIQGKTFTYKSGAISVFSIPVETIRSISYQEKGLKYGLAIDLMASLSEGLLLHHPTFSVKKMQKKGKKWGCDIFLPYFCEHTFQKIAQVLPAKEPAKCRASE